MGRIIAIDYGLKRTGLAVTDPSQIIATPLDVIESKNLLSYLSVYEQKEGFEVIVIGEPKKIDNSPTHLTKPVKELYQKLQKSFPGKKIVLHDERFTTKMALDAMIAGGTRKKDRKGKKIIDKISAAIILQSFLEYRNTANQV